MSDDFEPQVAAADRMRGGVLIAFDDGECALFSAALLYATLPSAQKVDETAGEEEL